MNAAVVKPLDVKLMNMSVAALVLVFVVLCGVAAVRWVSRLSAFDIAGITVSGDTTHNNSLTLRANVAPRIAGTFHASRNLPAGVPRTPIERHRERPRPNLHPETEP